jgi:hypothetical protein
MGVQRKRRRREERLEEEEQARRPLQEDVLEQERPKEKEATATDRVLDLQKTAGNRAVGAALSRWGLPWVPVAAAAQWPEEPQVVLDGVAIALDSFSWAEQGGGTGVTSPGAAQSNDVNVMTRLGDHSADLVRMASRGERIKTVIIVMPGKDGKGFTVTLHDVLITGYSISDKHESWSLNFAKKEFGQEPPKAQPRP